MRKSLVINPGVTINSGVNLSAHYINTYIADGLVLNVDASDFNSYNGLGSSWNDLSGNDNNGTIYNLTYDSNYGGEFYFTGGFNAGTYVDFGTSRTTLDAINSSITIDIIINATSADAIGENIIISRGSSDMAERDWELQLGFYNGGNSKYPVFTSGGATLVSSIPIDFNSYYHICISYSYPDTANMYLNGVLVSSETITAPIGNTAGWGVMLGHGVGAAQIFYNGKIPSCRIYNRALTENEVQHNYNVAKRTFNFKPTGLTAAQASASAWQIKQDYPNSIDGLYWIKNPNINNGDPFQIYADMTTHGGGWTLIMLNNASVGNYWTIENAILRNPTTPPTSPNDRPRNDTSQSDLYSIIGWADYIKRSPSGFDYMMDAYDRGRNGGIWTANPPYSFVERHNGQLMGNYQQNTVGWRKNITEVVRFNAGAAADTATWDYTGNSIEARMPWYGLNVAGDGIDANAGNGFITTNGEDGGWWGTLITDANQGGWIPAPWIGENTTGSLSVDISNPGIIWYWVR